jgi:hypothetical protein
MSLVLDSFLLPQWRTVTSETSIPVTPVPPSEHVRPDSLQEIPLYRTSREITMFREAFQELM